MTFLIILSKIMISILIALGPLFIISTLFDATKSFFVNWLNMLCRYGLILILLFGINKFALDIFDSYLSAAVADNTILISTAAPTAVMALIIFFLLCQISKIAKGLGAGIAIQPTGKT